MPKQRGSFTFTIFILILLYILFTYLLIRVCKLILFRYLHTLYIYIHYIYIYTMVLQNNAYCLEVPRLSWVCRVLVTIALTRTHVSNKATHMHTQLVHKQVHAHTHTPGKYAYSWYSHSQLAHMLATRTASVSVACSITVYAFLCTVCGETIKKHLPSYLRRNCLLKLSDYFMVY